MRKMQYNFLHRQPRQKLLVFLNGWGMDEQPLSPLLTTRYDVLVVYDYTHLREDTGILKLLEEYQERVLIAWSMGVLAGQLLFSGDKDLFNHRIAINGTLCPIDNDFGIPLDNYRGTLAQFNETSRLKFYRRMCRQKGIVKTFLENMPRRSLQNQREELAYFWEQKNCLEQEQSIYDDVIVSSQDFIVPTANQVRYWEGSRIIMVEAPHFPFYDWTYWDDIVQITIN